MAKNVVVTGGNGMLGRALTQDLMDAGFAVISIDRSPNPSHKPSWVADLRDPAVMMQASAGCYGIVHLAAHIAPNMAADHDTFNDNVRMTYNVYNAAFLMGVRRVVVASSTAAYGFLYGARNVTPSFLPIDENHICRPIDAYGQSKIVGEMLADSFSEKGIQTIVSLRFPGVNYDPTFQRIESYMSDPSYRAPGFWSYIDVRDASRACVTALVDGRPGHRVYNVAAVDSNMRESTPALISRFFPELQDIRRMDESNWSGIDSSRIEHELGFTCQISWKDVLDAA